MKDEEKKISDILESMKGSQKAKPDKKVWLHIQKEIGNGEAKVVSMVQRRWAVAAAALLLVVNTWALSEFYESKNIANVIPPTVEEGSPLLLDYQIYD